LVPPRTPLEVVLGGVDLRAFTRDPDAAGLRRRLGFALDDFVIFAPRLFWPLQNIETIVRAMPHLLSADPRARLLLVKYRAAAYPDHEARIERLIDDLGIRPAVRLVAQIPYSEMPAHYSATDCTVSVPSTDGTPMTVMESLAVGTPAVVSDLPDYDPEIFVDGETVVRVRLGDPSALADGVARLMRDAALREELGRNGRRIVRERADYGAEMSRLESLYARLLSSRV
jgi:phosphatidylinositol alpha-1,6-mannosyltransferase